MKSRKEIIDKITEIFKNESELTFRSSLELAKIEILLDIRDQNETIISQLNAMKRYSVNSNDINISKIWDKSDDKL